MVIAVCSKTPPHFSPVEKDDDHDRSHLVPHNNMTIDHRSSKHQKRWDPACGEFDFSRCTPLVVPCTGSFPSICWVEMNLAPKDGG